MGGMGGAGGGFGGFGAGGGFGAAGGTAAGPGVYAALDAGTLPIDFSGAGDIGPAGGAPGTPAGMGGGSGSTDILGSLMGIMQARTPSQGGASAQADAQRKTFNQLLNTFLGAASGGAYSANPDAVVDQARQRRAAMGDPALPSGGRLVPLTSSIYEPLLAIYR